MSDFFNTVELKISYTVPGKGSLLRAPSNRIRYVEAIGPTTPVSLSAFLQQWKAQAQALLRAALDYTCIIAEYTVIQLDTPTIAAYTELPALHGQYNMTPGAPAPSVNSAFLYIKTNRRGKGSWGGIHLPGLPAAGIDTNEFTSAYQIILDALKVGLLTPFTDSAGLVWYPAVVSGTKSSLVVPPPAVNVVALKAFNSLSAWDDNVRTMRRRSEGLVRA